MGVREARNFIGDKETLSIERNADSGFTALLPASIVSAVAFKGESSESVFKRLVDTTTSALDALDIAIVQFLKSRGVDAGA